MPAAWGQVGCRGEVLSLCSHCCSPDPYSEKHSLGDSFIAGHCKRVEIFSLSSSVYQWILAKTGITPSPSPTGTMRRYIHSVVWSTYSKEHRKSHRNTHHPSWAGKRTSKQGKRHPTEQHDDQEGNRCSGSDFIHPGHTRTSEEKKYMYIFKTYITLLIHKRCKLMCNPCIDVHT